MSLFKQIDSKVLLIKNKTKILPKIVKQGCQRLYVFLHRLKGFFSFLPEGLEWISCELVLKDPAFHIVPFPSQKSNSK